MCGLNTGLLHEKLKHHQSIKCFAQTFHNEFWEPRIISIEEVPNPTDYVYDLTVKDTRTFNIYNGLALYDTFHFAGVASKSNVTRGVPRIEEILSLSSEIKNPSLSIYLNKEDETNKERARTIMYMLEHTKLQELVKNVQLCFDPDDLNTLMAMVNNLPKDWVFSAFSIGLNAAAYPAAAILAGGNIRVGLEDSIYLSRGVFATNAQLVERAATVATNMGASLIGPDAVRHQLGLVKQAPKPR